MTTGWGGPVAATDGATRPPVEGEAQYEKLSPGPGRPACEVSAHQRARAYKAMIELAAEVGYANVAVADLVKRAKVSSRAFYEQFHGKEDCFLRTHELIVRRTAQRVIASQAGEQNWQERLRLAFRAFVRELDREPGAARLAFVEVHLDGPSARAQARKAELLFSTLLAESFKRAPDGLSIPALATEAIVAGIAEVARRRILFGKQRGSARLAGDLLEWTLACRERAGAPLPTFPPIPSSKPATERSRSGSSDRDLCFAAIEKLAVAQGQTHLTAPLIRAAAGVSLSRFNAEFASVEDCLCAARAERLDPALARVEHARASTAGGKGTGAAVQALCAELVADPALASLCFSVDCPGAPGNGRREPNTQIVDRVAKALYGAGAAKRPSIRVQAGAGMVWAMVGTHAMAQRWALLRDGTPLLSVLA